MKIVRFLDDGGVERLGALGVDGSARLVDGGPLGPFRDTGVPARVAKLLAPIVPTQILCIGLNYRRHAEEVGAVVPEDPVLFVKGPNALQNPGDPIVLPRWLRSDEVDYECELAVVIGRTCRNVRREDAMSVVAGFTCANDVSSRDWQITRGGGQWCRGKFFDTFAPLGPCLVTPDELGDPHQLGIRTILNGRVVQDSNTNDMIFDVPTLIAFLTGSTTLPAGTVVLTGTPEGVGLSRMPRLWLAPGDEVTIEIDGIGALTNPVVEEPVAEGAAGA